MHGIERLFERRRGFTLIEMLVVLAIISVLAGLSMVGLQRARLWGNEKATKTEVQMLAARAGAFANEWREPPPSLLSDVKLKTNGINEGNESLFAWLLTRKHGGPFADDLKEDRWRNADGDELKGADIKVIQKEIDWVRGSSQLLEYVDMWGNPFVYIVARDYGKKFKYQALDGEVFEVEARKNAMTGTYFAPTTFQIWSLGNDGVNQNGEGDDIVSWK